MTATTIPTRITLDFEDQRLIGSLYKAEGEQRSRVLLCHGFSVTRMGVGRAFVDLARRLVGQGCSVYAFDRLGHGESDGVFHDVSVPCELRKISAMLDVVLEEADGPVHLLGHSLGGMEAAVVTGRRPGDVASLTLWAAAAVFVDDIADNQIQGKSLDTARKTGTFDFEGQALGLTFVDTAEGFDPYAGLDAFHGPVWLHQGGSDQVVPMRYAERYAATFGQRATLYRYPDADHGWNSLPERQQLLYQTAADLAQDVRPTLA